MVALGVMRVAVGQRVMVGMGVREGVTVTGLGVTDGVVVGQGVLLGVMVLLGLGGVALGLGDGVLDGPSVTVWVRVLVGVCEAVTEAVVVSVGGWPSTRNAPTTTQSRPMNICT